MPASDAGKRKRRAVRMEHGDDLGLLGRSHAPPTLIKERLHLIRRLCSLRRRASSVATGCKGFGCERNPSAPILDATRWATERRLTDGISTSTSVAARHAWQRKLMPIDRPSKPAEDAAERSARDRAVERWGATAERSDRPPVTKGITSDPAAPTTPEPRGDNDRRPTERAERIPTDEPPPPTGALRPDRESGQGVRLGDVASEKVRPDAPDQLRASYEAEDRVADALAVRGYIVRQMPENKQLTRQIRAEYGLPEPPRASKNPDLYVGTPPRGDYVDVLCPEAVPNQSTGSRANEILGKAMAKVQDGQAQRIVIELNRPGQPITAHDLRQVWAERYQEQADRGEIYHRRGQGDERLYPLRELAVYDGNRLTYLYPPDDQEQD
ncbi:MAG: hypothetical protein AAGD35_19610 [Actinomycetota bacterium]